MKEKVYRFLAINPGSTSTKLGVFENDVVIAEEVIRHPKSEIDQFDTIADQKEMRLFVVEKMLADHHILPESLDAVVGRGGITEPIDSGVYAVDEHMLYDLMHSDASAHASALGGILAAEFGKKYGKLSFVVDPVVVDEMDQNARLTGMPGIERRCVFHALNQKAVARRCAKDIGSVYEN